MDYDRGGNYKNKKKLEVTCSKRVKCSFELRYMPNYCGRNIIVKYGIHNHDLAEDLDDCDILGRLKPNERLFLNDMTKYHMALRFIVVALKDMGVNDLTTMQLVYKARLTY